LGKDGPLSRSTRDLAHPHLQLEGVRPVLRVDRQHVLEEFLQPLGHGAPGPLRDVQNHLGVLQQSLPDGHDLRALPDVRAEQLALRLAVDEGDPLDHRPDDDAQREDVGLGRVVALPHLGRHVEVGAAGRRQPELVDVDDVVLVAAAAARRRALLAVLGVEARAHFAEAEVGHFEDGRAGLLRDEDVVRLEVAVDDVVLVQKRHGARQLAHEAAVGLGVGPPGQDVLVEVAALAELHDEPEVARLLRVARDALACGTDTRDIQTGTREEERELQ